MEYNTLFLYTLLSQNQVKEFIQKLIKELEKAGIEMLLHANIQYDIKNIFNTKKDEVIFVSDYFKDKNFPFQIKLILSCLKNKTQEKNKIWFEFCIKFKSSHLAKDRKYNDFCISEFKYSEKIKIIIKNLSEKLIKTFPESYVFFNNEFNDTQPYEFLINNSYESNQFSEFEMAIIPKIYTNRIFETSGKTIEKENYIILISPDFL